VNRVVLDASAVLALINTERGAEKLTLDVMNVSVSSTVNLAEVHSKLVNSGVEPARAWEVATATIREFVSFTIEQARLAGSLVPHTRALGLSLGDRACLALGLELNAPVYTADRSWKALKLGIPIHVIR
jgi:ribonuclease VapC